VTAIHRGRHTNVRRYDLPRAYTWAMQSPVPTGAGVHSRSAEWFGEEALYRTREGWRWGYDVEPGDTWRQSIHWKHWRQAHAVFLERCAGMVGEDGERLAKQLCNALYGKHGE